MLQVKTEVPCQVLIQLRPPEAASLHKIQQRLATIVTATEVLASNNIKVCICLYSGQLAAVPAPDVLHALAPVLQQFGSGHVDNDYLASRQSVTDSHVRALLPGVHCITSLSLCWRLASYTSLDLLAKFSNLRQLELQLDEAGGLRHLSGLKGLLELHLKTNTTDMSDSTCGDILENNRDSLLHVSLSAGTWDARTYMGLSRLCELRTFSLTVCSLQQDDTAFLAQVRPSQSMSITIHKTNDHEVVAGVVPTMHNLVSLTLVGLDLTCTDIQPQPSLRSLTIRSVFMSSTRLRQVFSNCPSLQRISLQEVQGLQFCMETVYTLVQLRELTTLWLSHMSGLSLTICYIDTLFRAQQSIGLAQPKIDVIFMTGETNQMFFRLCIDHTSYPVLSHVQYDERRATHTQRCWAQIAYPSARVGQGLYSMLVSTPTRLATYALAAIIATSSGQPDFLIMSFWFFNLVVKMVPVRLRQTSLSLHH